MIYRILFFFLIISSCSPKRYELIGEYENKPKLNIYHKIDMLIFNRKYIVSNLNLQLFQDSTFRYTDCGHSSYGKWKTKNDELLFYIDFYHAIKDNRDTIYVDSDDHLFTTMKIKGNKLIEKPDENVYIILLKKE